MSESLGILKADLINDSGIMEGRDGLVIRRIYCVSGIDSTSTASYQLLSALLAPGLPSYGNSHPDITACRVISREARPMPAEKGHAAHDKALVVITYEGKGWLPFAIPTTITFGAATRQIQTDVAYDNTTPLTVAKPANIAGENPQRAVVPRIVTDRIITFSRWFRLDYENGEDMLTYPTRIETLQDKYNNKVNSGTFRGLAAHCWKATVTATTQDKGRSYDVQVTLESRTESWDEWSWWTHPQNGSVPPGVTRANAPNGVKKQTTVYGEADFSEIGDDLDALDDPYTPAP